VLAWSGRTPALRDLEGSVHASAAVGLAIVGVVALGVELLGERRTLLTQLAIHRDGLLGNAVGDGLLVEDDVVGAALVVGPRDGVAGADRELVGLEDELASVRAHLHHLGLRGEAGRVHGGQGHAGRQARRAGHRVPPGAHRVRLDDGVQVVVERKHLERLGRALHRVSLGVGNGHVWLDAGAGVAEARALLAEQHREQLAAALAGDLEVVRHDLSRGLRGGRSQTLQGESEHGCTSRLSV